MSESNWMRRRSMEDALEERDKAYKNWQRYQKKWDEVQPELQKLDARLEEIKARSEHAHQLVEELREERDNLAISISSNDVEALDKLRRLGSHIDQLEKTIVSCSQFREQTHKHKQEHDGEKAAVEGASKFLKEANDEAETQMHRYYTAEYDRFAQEAHDTRQGTPGFGERVGFSHRWATPEGNQEVHREALERFQKQHGAQCEKYISQRHRK